jgi:hypothetical protein
VVGLMASLTSRGQEAAGCRWMASGVSRDPDGTAGLLASSAG